MFPLLRLACLLLLLPGSAVHADKPAAPPRTVAEKTDYHATSLHADVVSFCEDLVKQSSAVKFESLGTTHEGRKIPLLIVADPPVSAPQQVGNRTVVLLLGNIHAGEVDGKEALQMLARDLATGKERELLKELVVLILPNFNADGNEKVAKTNRREQNGPAEVGTRANAQKLDLNRDFVKLISPEVRALVRLLAVWNPAVFIDTHTTNGSHHRQTISYDGPRHPAGDPRLVRFTREQLLPDIGERIKKNDGLESGFYGIMSKDRKRWETYEALPRYGIVHAGLRNRIAILCESYTHASFKERVLASRAFVRSCLESIVANKVKIRTLLDDARKQTVEGGRKPRADDEIVLRFRTVAEKQPLTIRGFVEEMKDGKIVPTNRPHDYRVEYLARCEPILSVARPFAYLLPPTFSEVVANLQRQGIEVEQLREDLELDVQVYRLDKLSVSPPLHGLETSKVEATSRKHTQIIPAGTIVVRTAQPLGRLASYLLEPQSDDGLCFWGFFGKALEEGKDFPVLRLPAPAPLLTAPARPQREARAAKKPLTLEALMSGQLPNFSGTPIAPPAWLDDEHFLQTKDRQHWKVHAATGRATPFLDSEKLARCIGSIPGINKNDAEARARAGFLRMTNQRAGILIEQGTDLWYCPFDAEKAIRLTSKPGRKELIALSPDGKHVAFVRSSNLFVIDIATQTEKQLTKDGSDVIFNGKAGWVYFEEIFNRNWNAFWWSPDSRHLAFFRTDESKLKKFTVLDQLPLHQTVENTPYPKAGDPNPTVKLGVVAIESGEVRWAPQGDNPPEKTLISRVGWTPDSRLYYYLQDRQQTWLDFAVLALDGKAATLFRDKTKAWIEDQGAPVFLKDGSFLWLSERNGWKHLYRYAPGKELQAITTGNWEIRQFLHADEETGWLYLLGTKDSPIAQNVYRVRFDGSELTRLTRTPGDHLASPRFGSEPTSTVSPKGSYFIDSWSNITTTPSLALFRTDGTRVRTLDSNPVYTIEEYEFLPWECVQIKTTDGFLMEGMILLPPKLDPAKKYPVWVKTYGGPHAPTIRDTWQAGRIEHQAHARAGYIVFLVDPRSASGKGAVSTWTCYKQLGVQELKDMETAVKWLCQRPYVDAKRIGLSGHSYGGFLTAFALTHSKVFSAGIAGAPVTDWHLYDSIYTERYMLTPKENADGYAKTSVVRAAKELHGKLLILHGNMDDNVHVQNTLRLVDALQKADRDFDLMLYPQARHGLFGKHYRRLINEFMQKSLKPGA